MCLDTGGHRKDIGVKNDVVRIHAHRVGQNPISALADFDLAFAGVGLAGFVKRHDDAGGTVSADLTRLFDKARFAFFQADRINNGLALDAFQTGFDHFPFRAVDHDGNPGNIRFGRNQVEIASHGSLGV